MPAAEAQEVAEVFESYGLTPDQSAPMVEALQKNPRAWVDFMMRFELGLQEPDPKHALTGALTIAGSYIAGGFIPLSPYIVLSSASRALPIFIGLTLLALTIFGYAKGRFTGTAPLKSAAQTALIGGLAAAAFAIAHAIS